MVGILQDIDPCSALPEAWLHSMIAPVKELMFGRARSPAFEISSEPIFFFLGGGIF